MKSLANPKLTSNKVPLIFTRSDQLDPLEQLITTLPEAQFIIAAFTEVSSKIKQLLQYPNVWVQYATTMDRLLATAQNAQLFLDLSDPIDEGIQSQLQALGKPFLAIRRPDYVNEHVEMMDTPERLIARIKVELA